MERKTHHFQLIHQRAPRSVPARRLPGEIDLLIADELHGRLWVIEAKNPHGAIAPHNAAQHLDKFDDHRAQLLAKAEAIAAHLAEAARACNVHTHRIWRVQPLIVIRSIAPAAFITNPRAPFTTPDHLTQVLTDPADTVRAGTPRLAPARNPPPSPDPAGVRLLPPGAAAEKTPDVQSRSDHRLPHRPSLIAEKVLEARSQSRSCGGQCLLTRQGEVGPPSGVAGGWCHIHT